MDNINTEALFYSSNYTTKSGWKITLQLPDEHAARELDAIGAGKRYMLAMVPLTDDDQPEPIKPKGGKLAQIELAFPPRWDGMAVAGGRLYMATLDGKVLCLAGR